MLSVIYAECSYAECHYAECRYAECRYSKCHYAECRGAILKCFSRRLSSIKKLHYALLELMVAVQVFDEKILKENLQVLMVKVGSGSLSQ
jgi:hypothetical protein